MLSSAKVLMYEPETVQEMIEKIERIRMTANSRQVAGTHYKSGIQHWDYVVANDLDYFQGQITKYVTRWKKKNGLADLLKAQHFLEKYIEVQQKLADNRCGDAHWEPETEATSAYVNQDR